MKYLPFLVSASVITLVMGGLVHLAQATATVPESSRLGRLTLTIPTEVPIYNPDESYGEENFRAQLPSRRLSANRERTRQLVVSVITPQTPNDCYDRRHGLFTFEKEKIGRRTYCISARSTFGATDYISRVSYTTPYFNGKLLVLQLEMTTPNCLLYGDDHGSCSNADLLISDREYFKRVIQSLVVTR